MTIADRVHYKQVMKSKATSESVLVDRVAKNERRCPTGAKNIGHVYRKPFPIIVENKFLAIFLAWEESLGFVTS